VFRDPGAKHRRVLALNSQNFFDHPLDVLTVADAVLALGLALLLLTPFTAYRHLGTRLVYYWGAGAGITFSLAWWAVVGYAFWAYPVFTLALWAALPALTLGAEAGVAGSVVLSGPWRIASVSFGTANWLLILPVAAKVIKDHLPAHLVGGHRLLHL
jgi:hypothetical protein